jgi:hypothetical protein
MILDISKFLTNILEKEMTISHLDTISVFVCMVHQLPKKISTKIKMQYGSTFLDDANYIISFKNNPIGFKSADKKKLLKLIKLIFAESSPIEIDVSNLYDLFTSIKDDVEVADESADSVLPEYMFIKLTLKK